MEVLFFRHQTDSQKRREKCNIYCRLTINGVRVNISMSEKYRVEIAHKDWDDAKKRVKENEPMSHIFNERIVLLESQINATHNDLLRRGKQVTAFTIKQMVESGVECITLTQGFELYFQDYKKDPDHCANSWKVVQRSRNKMTTYLIESKQLPLPIDDFDENAMIDFQRWLKNLKHKEGYIEKVCQIVKQTTKWCLRKKFISTDPLGLVTVKKAKKEPPIFLTQKQFECWKKYKFDNTIAQEYADLFILHCRTAFHYADLQQVIKNPDKYLKKGLDGKEWLYKPRQKNETEAKVPIAEFPEITKIIKKYGSWGKLPTKSAPKFNQWLKICVAEINIGIEKIDQIYPNLSIKHGRNTFCNWWINECGRSKESLLPIMGRVSDKDLDVYVRPDERAVIQAFKNK